MLACALAGEDEFGFFGAAEVTEPLSKILGKPCTPLTFGRHLDRMRRLNAGRSSCSASRAAARRYRFENPLLQPYVLMRGLAEGAVSFKDLA